MWLEGGAAFVGSSFGGTFCLLVEVFLHAEAFFAFGALDPLAGAIGEDAEAVAVVPERGLQDVEEAVPTAAILDWDHQLDAFVEVTRHPVG